MKWKVLISSAHMQLQLDKYRKLLEQNNIEADTIIRPQFVPEADFLEIVEPYDAIVSSDDEITDKVLARAKNLKVISKWGVGLNSIDLESAKRRGIAVYNSPGAFSESCANMVFSYLLHFARRVSDQDNSMRNGKWSHEPGMALAGKTLGIIGVGNVGRAVIKRAQAFDMRVLGFDIKKLEFDFMRPLETLLKESDFISLNCDLNPTSYHLINKETLALMKPTAYLFNTARGQVVDEEALIEVLQKKKIAGAGLDVFENEPLPSFNPLRQMGEVILTPHNAYNTKEAEDYVNDNTIRNLIEGLKSTAQNT
jgi:D-3-phosphoglycerate dehydrogenase